MSSVCLDSITGAAEDAVGADAALPDGFVAPATIISGADIARVVVMAAPDDGFFSLIRKSPREYSNSSRLCSAMVFRSCSIWSISGLTDGPLADDFEGFLRFIRFLLELYE